jgi:hypothetical protein
MEAARSIVRARAEGTMRGARRTRRHCDRRWAAFAIAVAASGCGSGGRNGGGSDAAPDLTTPGEADLANGGCGTATYVAKQSPAAMLVLLDRSASMADNNKYVSAAQAIVQAIDQDVFDTMAVGLMAAPSGTVAGPACIAGFPVACQAPPFPQVDLQIAGANKSNAPMGVRHDIKAWLAANSPDTGAGDATPMYSAIQAAFGALGGVVGLPAGAKRILMVVTDGSWDCTQFSTRPGYPDCNGCDHEWEKPESVITLVAAQEMDPMTPVESFVIGVPGADTFDASGCMYPPYHMRAGLSAIAYAGSPANAPANCTGKTFTDASPDPTVSCHFDMTQNNFTTQAVADAISQVRGKVLGCLFDLPAVDGGMIDPNEVNVTYTINGTTVDLSRRADPSNMCTAMGCWDYSSDGRVQLIGKACDDVGASPNAQVQIVLGCPTIIM